MLEFPELPKCPYHPDGPPHGTPLAKCMICWDHFYIPFNRQKELDRINREIDGYRQRVERANLYIAIRRIGFETEKSPPRDTMVRFYLPEGIIVNGKVIDDLMGGTYPVKDDAEQTPISEYLGWIHV
jgi:hypothetical protein